MIVGAKVNFVPQWLNFEVFLLPLVKTKEVCIVPINIFHSSTVCEYIYILVIWLAETAKNHRSFKLGDLST